MWKVGLGGRGNAIYIGTKQNIQFSALLSISSVHLNVAVLRAAELRITLKAKMDDPRQSSCTAHS